MILVQPVTWHLLELNLQLLLHVPLGIPGGLAEITPGVLYSVGPSFMKACDLDFSREWLCPNAVVATFLDETSDGRCSLTRSSPATQDSPSVNPRLPQTVGALLFVGAARIILCP